MFEEKIVLMHLRIIQASLSLFEKPCWLYFLLFLTNLVDYIWAIYVKNGVYVFINWFFYEIYESISCRTRVAQKKARVCRVAIKCVPVKVCVYRVSVFDRHLRFSLNYSSAWCSLARLTSINEIIIFTSSAAGCDGHTDINKICACLRPSYNEKSHIDRINCRPIATSFSKFQNCGLEKRHQLI